MKEDGKGTTTGRTTRRGRFALGAAAAGLLAVAGMLSTGQTGVASEQSGRTLSRSAASDVVMGFTAPSQRIALAFDNLGKISEVLVREGHMVEAGQLLMRQDDRADQARLRALETDADVEARVKLAETQRDLAQVELDILRENPRVRGAAEIRRAELDLVAAETRIVEEERQGLAAEARAEEQRILIDQKQLRSPAEAVVRRVEAKEGEVYGPQTAAVELVAIDPLYVEVILADARQVEKLTDGATLEVRYHGEDEWREATVIFIDPIVREEAQTRAFRLEMANPDLRPAGLMVEVRFPQ